MGPSADEAAQLVAAYRACAGRLDALRTMLTTPADQFATSREAVEADDAPLMAAFDELRPTIPRPLPPWTTSSTSSLHPHFRRAYEWLAHNMDAVIPILEEQAPDKAPILRDPLIEIQRADE